MKIRRFRRLGGAICEICGLFSDRVLLLTMTALLGTLLLNGTVQIAWEDRPLLDAVADLVNVILN